MNNNLNDGGPAFPWHNPNPGVCTGEVGMSLRDYFAAAAFQAIISKAPLIDQQGEFGKSVKDKIQYNSDIAESAYWMADAMISARGAETEISMADQELSEHLKNIAINQEILSVLEEALEWDGYDDQGVKSVWLDKAEAAIAKAKNQSI